jgi:hypothetical protein
MISIDRIAHHVAEYNYAALVNTVNDILKDIFRCIIKEQCSNEEERK